MEVFALKKPLILAVIVALLLTGCENTGPTKAMNLSRTGQIAVRGDRVFYIVQKTLFQMKLDGTDRNVIAPKACNRILDVSDDYLYYMAAGIQDPPGSPETICRVRQDGSGRTILAKDVDYHTSCTNQWIYYQAFGDKTLKRVSRDGSRLESFPDIIDWPILIEDDFVLAGLSGMLYPLSDKNAKPIAISQEPIRNACRSGDAIYASVKNCIIKFDIVKKTSVKLPVDAEAWSIQTVGDRVYCIGGGYRLFSVKADGTDLVKLTKGLFPYAFQNSTTTFVVEGGWVYYTDQLKNILYRVSLDGRRTEQLTEKGAANIEISNATITYVGCQRRSDIDFTYDKDIIRMNMDGKGVCKMQIPDRNAIFPPFLCVGDYVYVTIIKTPANQPSPPAQGVYPDPGKLPEGTEEDIAV
jgi:hypothetical protein